MIHVDGMIHHMFHDRSIKNRPKRFSKTSKANRRSEVLANNRDCNIKYPVSIGRRFLAMAGFILLEKVLVEKFAE